MAVRKLSEITDGGAVAGATDKVVAVRNGTADALVTPVALDTPNEWDDVQSFFGGVNFLSTSDGGLYNMVGGGHGDMSMQFQGVSGGALDIRVGMEMIWPLALQSGPVGNPNGALEWVWVGQGSNGTGSGATPYSRIECGWQSSGTGWYAWHMESGTMPDVIPAPGGLLCPPQSFGCSDHTSFLQNLHLMGGTDGAIRVKLSDGPPITYQSLTGSRVFVPAALFMGLMPYNSGGAIYDGNEQLYLGPLLPVTDGHHDSHSAVWFGTWHVSSAAHVADWRWRVNVTDNSGTNKFILEMRTDLNSYAARLTIPATVPVLATGASHTVDELITFLQGLGLCKQS